MVFPFSFTFKSPALHKYVSVSSLLKLSKFLILQFLVKCCKLHSVFKILSKSHMLDILSKILLLILSALYVNWANMFTLISKIKNSICTYSIVSRVFIYASNKPLCGTLIISFGKNSICTCYYKQIKTSCARISSEYKICIGNLSLNNYIYLPRQQR